MHFNYRSSQKQNNEFINGIFEFKIDGEVQRNITNEVEYSDIWFDSVTRVLPGVHKLEWIYRKYNVDGTSDDLSAEIQKITITGVKAMNREC